MTEDFLEFLTNTTEQLLPHIKRIRPPIYWHMRASLQACQKYRDYVAARDLAEFHLYLIEQDIKALTEKGDKEGVRCRREIKQDILEGIGEQQ